MEQKLISNNSQRTEYTYTATIGVNVDKIYFAIDFIQLWGTWLNFRHTSFECLSSICMHPWARKCFYTYHTHTHTYLCMQAHSQTQLNFLPATECGLQCFFILEMPISRIHTETEPPYRRIPYHSSHIEYTAFASAPQFICIIWRSPLFAP